MIELYSTATPAGRRISRVLGVPGQGDALCTGRLQEAIPTR